jgi:hypothetical protein
MTAGLWISQAELYTRPLSGADYSGAGEVYDVADGAWPLTIDLGAQTGDKSHLYALAGGLIYLRFAPDPSADEYRTKVADYIQLLIDEGLAASVDGLAWARNIGAFVIAADMIDLASYDATLSADFDAFLDDLMVEPLTGAAGMSDLLDGARTRPNNIGSYCRLACILIAEYRGDTATVDDLVEHLKFFLGDREANGAVDPFTGDPWGGPKADVSWHEDPTDPATYRGIVSVGVTRDGHDWSGIQPEEMRRDATYSTYPPVTTLRYVEESLDALLATVEVLRRTGRYGAVETWSDDAVGRAVTRLKYLADNHPASGWVYFETGHEAARPLVNYLYGYDYPETRVRSQLGGAAKGFAFTHWTHGGREAEPCPSEKYLRLENEALREALDNAKIAASEVSEALARLRALLDTDGEG